ncbi:MAG: TonB-dependent receptor [Flavobacteriales bacterium]|nr:TonB-dependent receptor [Flavobacteriales bacterium]MCB9197198.1 TonB-dependent receptor [Flavobacteriales bacterium]
MKTILLILGIIGLNMSFLAQNGAVYGKVIDPTENAPLEYSTIALKSTLDSTLVTGTITNSEGEFLMQKIPYGSYFLVIDFIGYESFTIEKIEINKDANSFDAGTVGLKTAGSLNELEVKVDKSLMENRIDKKVFNASESEVSAGGTGLDLMRTVPLITVDENDNIQLRGDANVTIFVDGRPSAIPVSQLLKQLPASSIDKIELITNPSAKYDPEGTSGIINIILKKEKMKGFNGTLTTSAGYGVFYKTNNSLTMNYRNSHFNISSSLGLSDQMMWFGGSLDRDVMINDSTWDRLRQTDYGERRNTGLSGNLGVDVFINDHNTIYGKYTIHHNQNDGERIVKYTNVDDLENDLTYSERNGVIDVPADDQVINFGWQRNFKKDGHHLDLDVNLNTYTSLADERLKQDYYDLGNIYYTKYQNTLSDDLYKTYLSKLDYVLPINDSTELEAGFHFTHRQAQVDFYSASGISSESLVPDTSIINNFNYLQDVYAPYITFSKQMKKLGFKVGLRAEQTNTNSYLITTNEKFNHDYFMLFPSFHLNYKFNETTELQLSYGKRINRPEHMQLNPFTNYSDPLVLETGNPFLLPEVIHVNELSFNKYWDKVNISASGYYRAINNLIRRNLDYDGVMSYITFQNLGSSHLTGGDLLITYSPFKGARIMSSTNIWNTSTKDPQFSNGNTINLRGLYSSLIISNKFGKDWSTQIWASVSPRQKVLQGYIIPNYGGGFSITKTILNQKGRLTLSVYDILKSRRFAFEANPQPDYTFYSYRRWESRSVYLSFTYSFGKMIQGKQKRTTKENGSSDDVSIPDMQ